MVCENLRPRECCVPPRLWGPIEIPTLGLGSRLRKSTSVIRSQYPDQLSKPEELALLQLRVLRLSLFQDWDVGVGVFPEGEEVFVGGEGPDAGGIGICALRGSRLQGIGAGHAQMRQGSCPAVPDDSAVVENLLKLGGGTSALSGYQVCLAPHIPAA